MRGNNSGDFLLAFWQRLGIWLGGAANRTKGVQSGDSANSLKTAKPVTIDSTLQVSAAWACVKLIAETVGSLPVKLYNVDARGVKTENKLHPLAVLLSGKVNRWQGRQAFFQTLMYQFALQGNFYCVKQYSDLVANKGQLVSLLPLMSWQMQVTLEDDQSLLYRYIDGSGLKIFAEQTIWHHKMFGNGVIGLSPMSYARGSLGIAIAAEESVTNIYDNGGKPSGVLTIDKVITKEQREKIKDNFKELHEGNQDRLFVLEAGMKYQQVSLSPQDIELLSSRRFQVEDIARFFGVPSVLINDLVNTTSWGSGIQNLIEGWYKTGLRPMLKLLQESMALNLLTAQERATMCIEFDVEELLQQGFTDRVTNGKNAVQGGLLKPNEWRSKEGLPPAAGGDSLLVQQQMVSLEQLDKIPRGNSSNAAQTKEA